MKNGKKNWANEVTITSHKVGNRRPEFLLYFGTDLIEKKATGFRQKNGTPVGAECLFEKSRLIVIRSDDSRKTLRLPEREGKYKLGYVIPKNGGPKPRYDLPRDFGKGKHPSSVEPHKDCIIINL